MAKFVISKAQSATASYNISEYTSVSVITHGGTGTFTLKIGVDNTVANLEQHSTPAADTITTITDNALILEVTVNTGGTYDVIGEVR